MGLMHREASAKNRATILSLGSLVMQAGGAVAGPLLGLLAAHTSIATAMVVAGAISTMGFVCFIPAWRRGRTQPRRGAAQSRTPPPPRDPPWRPDGRGWHMRRFLVGVLTGLLAALLVLGVGVAALLLSVPAGRATTDPAARGDTRRTRTARSGTDVPLDGRRRQRRRPHRRRPTHRRARHRPRGQPHRRWPDGGQPGDRRRPPVRLGRLAGG